MTWFRFRVLLIRSNIGIAALLWVGFWGYGLAINDIPPTSVLPGLLLLTAFLCLGTSIILFLVCHIALFVQAKINGTLPAFSISDYIAACIGGAGILVFILVEIVRPSDAVSVPLSIISGSSAILGTTYWTIALSGQLFCWQFAKK